MTPYIIAAIILAVGAVLEIVAGIFTAKMLKKREEGLDRRQTAIAAREDNLDSREAQLDRRAEEIDRMEGRITQGKPIVPRCVHKEKTVFYDNVHHDSISGENAPRALAGFVWTLKHALLEELFDRIIVKKNDVPGRDAVQFIAELWILEDRK